MHNLKSKLRTLTLEKVKIKILYILAKPLEAINILPKIKSKLRIFLLRIKRPFFKTNVIFLVQNNTLWDTYEFVYKLLADSKKFNMNVVLIPARQPGQFNDFRLDPSNELFFKTKNIPYILGFDETNNKWLNLKKLKPDFIFIQTPYDCQRPSNYSIIELNSIAQTCYIPYGIMIASIQTMQFNLDFYHNCHHIFCETEIHKELFYKYSDLDKSVLEKQITVTGYPKLDLYKNNYTADQNRYWKLNKENNNKLRRLIWSPHWTLPKKHNSNFNEKQLCFSDFFKNYKYFYNLLLSNQDIEIILKPHPLLWNELINNKLMSEKEITEFKEKWNALPNASIYEQGYYFGLFVSSDAILNSSVSFLAEYYPTKKPILFIVPENIDTTLNEYGQKIIKGVYIAHNQEEITSFIKQVVIDNNDYMYDKRMSVMDRCFFFPKSSSSALIQNHLESV